MLRGVGGGERAGGAGGEVGRMLTQSRVVFTAGKGGWRWRGGAAGADAVLRGVDGGEGRVALEGRSSGC